MNALFTSRLAIASAVALLSSVAMAQTAQAPAKPAAKPAAATTAKPAAKPAAKPDTKAAEKTSTMSGKEDAGGKILSREELRSCFKQRDELATRVTQMETDRSVMDKERVELQQEQTALKTDNENAGGLRPLADALTAKFKQLQADSDALSKRITAYNDNKTMSRSESERERNAINGVSTELKDREKVLMAERTDLVTKSEDLSKALKTRADSLQPRLDAWNERNRKLNNETETLQAERKLWGTDCGNRRYREDDEKAILAGK